MGGKPRLAAAGVMNFVVLASALSACSAGLYSNGRLLKKLAEDGLAPKVFEKTSRGHVPAAAIIASGTLMLVGVAVNAIDPEKASRTSRRSPPSGESGAGMSSSSATSSTDVASNAVRHPRVRSGPLTPSPCAGPPSPSSQL
ncbi:amino acid permease [Streptomyces sp. NPDC051020]|uniref:amino acid permease n=1 Tax=Streptomyces sp. NPDC051020 TaxID=3155409 RepID=UPI0034269B97